MNGVTTTFRLSSNAEGHVCMQRTMLDYELWRIISAKPIAEKLFIADFKPVRGCFGWGEGGTRRD